MTINNILYSIEHRILPKVFYDNPQRFVYELLNNHEFIFDILKTMAQNNKIDNPYEIGQFTMRPFKLDESYIVIVLGFPTPKEEPLCYYVCVFTDNHGQNPAYFCVEKGTGDVKQPNEIFISSWTKDGIHLNYGKCVFDSRKAIDQCVEIYKNSIDSNNMKC